MKYTPQLDTLRAVAVLFVIIEHWRSRFGITEYTVPFGSMGVDIFFVLSGFLISRILLNDRQSAAASKSAIIKNFIARRILRIFPLYYLTLIAVFAFLPFIKNNFLYFATYTSNFIIYKHPDRVGPGGHFWSLAVEEQFYLLWPWLMLFIPLKRLPHVIISFIVVGFISRITLFALLPAQFRIHILIPATFDTFGIGALLAWVRVYRQQYLQSFANTFKKAALICLPLLILIIAFNKYQLLGRTVLSMMAAGLIQYALDDEAKHWSLNQRPLIFLGKISYGIYVFHPFVPYFLQGALRSLKLTIANPFAFYGLSLAMLITTAWLSYRFLETPFLKLKKYFSFNRIPARTIAQEMSF